MKGRFRPHYDQLMVTGEAMIKEQFLEYFEMDNMESNPENNLTITDGKTDVELKKQLLGRITKFMDYYGYCKADTEQSEPKDLRIQQRYQLLNVNNNIVLVPCIAEKRRDALFNYSHQLCHWYLHLLQMNGTEKEGDLNMAILNCQYSLPFFSHTRH